jgi:hypothetical protein
VQTGYGYALEDGIVAYYKFNETSGNLLDYSGNCNDGTVNGGVTRGAISGIIGDGYSFDGDGDYISVNDSNLLDVQNFTLSAWVS